MAIKASSEITVYDVNDGQNGADGTSIKSVSFWYKLHSSTSTPASWNTIDPPSGWSKTEPGYTTGSTLSLYCRTRTLYSDGKFEWSDITKSSSYEASKQAYNTANNAQITANEVNNKVDNVSGMITDEGGINDKLEKNDAELGNINTTLNGNGDDINGIINDLNGAKNNISNIQITLNGSDNQPGIIDKVDANNAFITNNKDNIENMKKYATGIEIITYDESGKDAGIYFKDMSSPTTVRGDRLAIKKDKIQFFDENYNEAAYIAAQKLHIYEAEMDSAIMTAGSTPIFVMYADDNKHFGIKGL